MTYASSRVQMNSYWSKTNEYSADLSSEKEVVPQRYFAISNISFEQSIKRTEKIKFYCKEKYSEILKNITTC